MRNCFRSFAVRGFHQRGSREIGAGRLQVCRRLRRPWVRYAMIEFIDYANRFD